MVKKSKSELIQDLKNLQVQQRTTSDPYLSEQILDKIYQIKHQLEDEVSYDDCVDITKPDPSEKVLKKTGLLPFDVFYQTLRENGFLPEEIYEEHIESNRKRFIRKTWVYKEGISEVETIEDAPFITKSGIVVEYDLFPKENIKKLKKNSKLKKRHPDKKYTYELVHVNPLKYKKRFEKVED